MISSDSQEALINFKRSLGATYSFVSDPNGELISLYGVKTLFFTFAKRRTFVIDTSQRVLYIDANSEAIDASRALTNACQQPPSSQD